MTQLEGQGCPSLRDSPVKNSLCGRIMKQQSASPLEYWGGEGGWAVMEEGASRSQTQLCNCFFAPYWISTWALSGW